MKISEEIDRENFEPSDVTRQLVANEPIVYLLPFGHIVPDEIESIYNRSDSANQTAMAAPARLYPNGAGTATIRVTVIDQRGRPVPGEYVSFRVQAINPTDAGWRTEDGVVARFPAQLQASALERILRGQIKLIGTVSPTYATTNAQGLAETVYEVSHIGGNQSQLAEEHVIATSIYGSTTTVIQIGYDWMANIPTVNGGLRLVGATGEHCHRDLVHKLTRLGNFNQDGSWPHPVTITDGNLRWGGLNPPHFSHRCGAELDFRPMTTDGNGGTWQSANYDRERTRKLVKSLGQLGADMIYFNDPQIPGATPLAGHDDHMLVSFANAVLPFALQTRATSHLSPANLATAKGS